MVGGKNLWSRSHVVLNGGNRRNLECLFIGAFIHCQGVNGRVVKSTKSLNEGRSKGGVIRIRKKI